MKLRIENGEDEATWADYSYSIWVLRNIIVKRMWELPQCRSLYIRYMRGCTLVCLMPIRVSPLVSVANNVNWKWSEPVQNFNQTPKSLNFKCRGQQQQQQQCCSLDPKCLYNTEGMYTIITEQPSPRSLHTSAPAGVPIICKMLFELRERERKKCLCAGLLTFWPGLFTY